MPPPPDAAAELEIAGPMGEPVFARPYRDERDSERIRSLLVETHPLVQPGWNWDIRRWDGWLFHREKPRTDVDRASVVGLWETEDRRLVGVVHPEAPGEAWIELHPHWRRIEPDILDWAEEHLSISSAVEPRTLALFVSDDDVARRELIERRGYWIEESGGWTRCLRFDRPLSVAASLPGAYRLRSTEGTDCDCARMATLLNAAFGRGAHSAQEYRTFMDSSPSFEHDLNLVAVAPDGVFAAHVGLTYDPVNRNGIVEPVCTHPDHRRLGLARTLLGEGLRRLEARGARTASLDTGDSEAANALYADCGFTDAYHGHVWRRAW
jgi:mycothiol synthase